MPELKPRSSELKTPELKPTISEMKRKDRVGAQAKPSASINCWTIRAEAQHLRANAEDLTDEAEHYRLQRFENQDPEI